MMHVRPELQKKIVVVCVIMSTEEYCDVTAERQLLEDVELEVDKISEFLYLKICDAALLIRNMRVDNAEMWLNMTEVQTNYDILFKEHQTLQNMFEATLAEMRAMREYVSALRGIDSLLLATTRSSSYSISSSIYRRRRRRGTNIIH